MSKSNKSFRGTCDEKCDPETKVNRFNEFNGEKLKMHKNVWIILLLLLLGVQTVIAANMEIKKIEIINARSFDEDDLLEIIHSEDGEEFEPRISKLDKILLTNFYKKHGFLDITVGDSIFFSRNREKVTIKYYITENQRYYYAGVSFKGVKDIEVEKLLERFEDIKKNIPFDESSVSDAMRQVENLYYNSGKPFVEFDVNYIFEQDSLIRVLVSVEEKQTVFIKDIKYFGLKMVQKFLVRRELEIQKGEKYNRSALEKSQQNIYRTGLFRYVRFEVEPIENEPGQVYLKILVQEKDPRWIGVRFGISHEQETYYGNKVELTLQGGHRNLFGTGRSISLHLTPSVTYDFDEDKLHNPNNKAALMYVEPWILNTRTPGTFQIAYEQYRPLNSGNFNLFSTSFDLNRRYEKYWNFSGALSLKLVDQLTDQDIDSTLALQLGTEKSEIYSLTFYGKRDKRKNLIDPKDGSYLDLSLAFSYTRGVNEVSDLITNQYITLIGSWQRYQPWRPKLLNFKRWHFTLASRLKAGAILEPWQSGPIPINDRFYAGGATTVRGYGEQLLGPAAATDDKGRITQAAGGKLLFLANIESRMPVWWIFLVEYFVDAGYVWAEVSDFAPKDIRVTTGLGLVAITPLGPVRLDYGYKLMRTAKDAAPGSYHIGIYFAF